LEKISAENLGVGGRLIMDRGKIMERKKLYWWGKPLVPKVLVGPRGFCKKWSIEGGYRAL
jgi:hypothetical protein